MRSARSRALASGNWKMTSPTDGLPSKLATDVLVLGAEFDAADVANAHDPPVGPDANDDVRELLRLLQAAEGGEGDLRLLAGRRRLLPDLAACHLRVLLADGQHDVVGGQVACRRAAPDPPRSACCNRAAR